ncbi:MAG: hypothetical protein C0478_11280 [Planctomyces sp.]|nr:hypothetical protein [Planctomyces sp.]
MFRVIAQLFEDPKKGLSESVDVGFHVSHDIYDRVMCSSDLVLDQASQGTGLGEREGRASVDMDFHKVSDPARRNICYSMASTPGTRSSAASHSLPRKVGRLI